MSRRSDFEDEEPTKPDVALSPREAAELAWHRLRRTAADYAPLWDEETKVPTGEEAGE